MATKTVWSYLINPFLTVTDESYRLAVRISTYHIGALKSKQGDPVFDVMINTYQPFHDALITQYEKWKTASGSQQGNTLGVQQLFNLLSSTKIKKWDIAIQNEFDNTSNEYKSILPNKRAPFQNGSQTDRLTSVKALANAIKNIAALATVHADVQNFYDTLHDALEVQKGSLALTGTESDQVETARVNMCVAQYANLGALINRNASTPEYINQFFDLVAIRSGTQVIFTGDTKPLEHENIFKHTFDIGDALLLKNEGIAALTFYLAIQKTDAPGTKTITVLPGNQINVAISDLGDIYTQKFLNVYNPDANSKGDWTVEFV